MYLWVLSFHFRVLCVIHEPAVSAPHGNLLEMKSLTQVPFQTN